MQAAMTERAVNQHNQLTQPISTQAQISDRLTLEQTQEGLGTVLDQLAQRIDLLRVKLDPYLLASGPRPTKEGQASPDPRMSPATARAINHIRRLMTHVSDLEDIVDRIA